MTTPEAKATDGLVEALRKCRAQFEFYVQAHMAKSPPDMDKAATNQEFVELCETALATIQEDEGWRPISEAPELDRIFVAGWQKPQGRCAGYWWWHEDAVADGMAIEHPEATLWHPIRFAALPAAPQGQSDHTGEGA